MSQLYSSVAGKIDASMVVLATGAPLTTGTVHCFVKRDSDGKWLKADTTWTTDTTKPTGGDIPTMTHVSGGLWTLAHTPAAADYYNINCIDEPVTCFPDNRTERVNSFDSFKADVSGLSTFDPIADEVKLTDVYNAAKTAAQPGDEMVASNMVAAPDNATITAIDAKTAKLTFTPENKVIAEATIDAEEVAQDLFEAGVASSADMETIAELVRRSLGLMKENSFVDNTTYDTKGNLLSARIRIYDSAANANTHGATGLIGTYNYQATYSSANKLTNELVKLL